MKLFALVVCFPYEGSYLLGVYSTHELAEAARGDPGPNGWHVIHEVELDAAKKFRGTEPEE